MTQSSQDGPKPVCLVRDPIRTFDSWKHVGWVDVNDFVNCCIDIIQFLGRSELRDTPCLLYERLVVQPRVEVKRICDLWGIPFSDDMLCFEKPLQTHLQGGEMGTTQSLLTTAESYTSIVNNIPWHGQLSNSEIDHIERQVGSHYMRCWGDRIGELRAALAKKTWICFDLDDTLHEFRKASAAAIESTMQVLQRAYGVPVQDLKDRYAEVLAQKTASAFVEGKTSHDYRRERFAAVMAHFSLPTDDDPVLDGLLDTYEAVLTRSLELKPGAVDLLAFIRARGKKVAVITEGPQDAQERTVERLGLAAQVDFLATTSRFEVSKTGGLFGRVLRHLDVDATDVAYVGDSQARDMAPAAATGIFAIHLSERDNVDLDARPPRINSLHKLKFIMSP